MRWAGTGGPASEPFDHLGAVQAAIDVVAEMDQDGVLDRPLGEVVGDMLVHRGQPLEAAMHVADRIDALAGREGGRGGEQGRSS